MVNDFIIFFIIILYMFCTRNYNKNNGEKNQEFEYNCLIICIYMLHSNLVKKSESNVIANRKFTTKLKGDNAYKRCKNI